MTERFQRWLVLVHVTLLVETLVGTFIPMSTRPGKLWLWKWLVWKGYQSREPQNIRSLVFAHGLFYACLTGLKQVSRILTRDVLCLVATNWKPNCLPSRPCSGSSGSATTSLMAWMLLNLRKRCHFICTVMKVGGKFGVQWWSYLSNLSWVHVVQNISIVEDPCLFYKLILICHMFGSPFGFPPMFSGPLICSSVLKNTKEHFHHSIAVHHDSQWELCS